MKHSKRKFITLTTTAAMILSAWAVAAEDSGKIYLNDAILENAKVEQRNNIDLIPLRAICENLGFEVNWIEESRTIELVKMPLYITCSPDRDGYTFSKTAPMMLGAAPVLIDDSTYVPTNFVNEILKGEISQKDGNFYINYQTEEDVKNVVTGTVCDIIIENDVITQIVIGDATDVETQTVFNISPEVYETIKDLDITIGTVITVETTDLMTMSIPPQMIPVSITVNEVTELPTIEGTVCDMIYEDEKLIQIVLGDANDPMSQTILNLSEEMAKRAQELNIVVGSNITAQTEDLQTLSLPPQMIPVSLDILEVADSVETEAVEGVICDLVFEDEKLIQIVLGDENDPMSQLVLNLSEDLAKEALELNIEKGMSLKGTASMMKTRSIPAQQPLISIEEIK